MYWITGILGVVLMAAPFMFSFTDNVAALWTSLIVGSVVAVVSFIEGTMRDKERWEYWTAVILGLAAIVAPFVFGFGNHATAMWTTVITGGLIALVAGSRLFVNQTG